MTLGHSVPMMEAAAVAVAVAAAVMAKMAVMAIEPLATMAAIAKGMPMAHGHGLDRGRGHGHAKTHCHHIHTACVGNGPAHSRGHQHWLLAAVSHGCRRDLPIAMAKATATIIAMAPRNLSRFPALRKGGAGERPH